MKKTWMVGYSTDDRSWYTANNGGNMAISRVAGENLLKKSIEKDRNGYSWGLFELVLVSEVKKEVVLHEPEAMDVNPIEAVPGPVEINDDEDGDGDFGDFEDDQF